MNDNAKAWVEVLRSGEYQQTRSILHRKEKINEEFVDSFCCLGVACDMAVKAGVIPEGEGRSSFASIIAYGDVDSILPQEVADWLGLASIRGDYEVEGFELKTALTSDNDNGKSFAEIADIIESEPKGLFKEEPVPA